MKRLSSSVLVLILFVCLYVFCVSTYTFITALHGINYWSETKNQPDDFPTFLRIKRDNDMLLTDSWETNITFNACCGVNEYLNSNFECIKSNFSGDGNLDKIQFLSEVPVLDENLTQNIINLSRVFMKYEAGEFCPNDEIMVVNWSPGTPDFYYISQKNGNILQISEDGETVLSNYSTSSYCVNEMQGRENSRYTVALVCPCNEKVCIQKCCQKGYYYNTVDNACKKESDDDIESYKPKFRDGVSYHLIHGVANCSEPDKMITNGSSSVKIQEDGQLVLGAEGSVFDRKKYCVDIFSNGTANTSYVNGFYCAKDAQAIMKKEETQESPAAVVIRIPTGDIFDPEVQAVLSANMNFAHFGLAIVILGFMLFIF